MQCSQAVYIVMVDSNSIQDGSVHSGPLHWGLARNSFACFQASRAEHLGFENSPYCFRQAPWVLAAYKLERDYKGPSIMGGPTQPPCYSLSGFLLIGLR